jgi:cytochrome c553
MSRRVASVLLLVAACAPSTPESPTWLADVRPILVANCVRCHGYPPIGGAPGTFRLDRYEDEFLDGQMVRGARTMAPFIAARASERGDMPPRGASLAPRQKDILEAWGDDPQPGSRAGNRPPTAALISQTVAGDAATLVVELADPDGDLVFGTLAGQPLRPGRHAVVLDLAGFTPGPLPLRADLDDGETSASVNLGELTVPARANTPPRLTFLAPERDDLLRGTVSIEVELVDPDAGAPPQVVLELLRPGLAQLITIPGSVGRGRSTIEWNTAVVPEATNWRLRAVITDGVSGAQAISESPEFIVSRAASADGYADVKPILDTHCARCHHPLLDPVTMAPDFSKLDDLRPLAGLAWRKVVQLREMPPPSTDLVLEPPPEALSEADRARLGAWLLAGAPP